MTAAGWTISIIAILIALVLAVGWERRSRRGAGEGAAPDNPPEEGTNDNRRNPAP
jgi:hypothetical protein